MHSITLVAVVSLAACSTALRPASAGLPAGTCRPADMDVAWLLPDGQQPVHDAWCAAVGPPLLRAAPGTDGGAVTPGAAPAVDSLLVVSWNIHVGGGEVRRFVRDLRHGTLTGAPVRHFALLLQEAWRAGDDVPVTPAGAATAGRIETHPPTEPRTGVDRLAQELGLHLLYVPSMANGGAAGGREDRGNAILSTLPLHDALALELPLKRQRRVAVAATVSASTSAGAEWSLQLSSVHLENRLAIDDNGLLGLTGAAARGRQMKWLLQALPPAPAAALAGDLNTWTDGEAEAAVQVTLPYFPQTTEPPPGPTHVSHWVFRERLDYLFARVPAGRMSHYSRAADAYGSDHYPLLAWIVPGPVAAPTNLSGH